MLDGDPVPLTPAAGCGAAVRTGMGGSWRSCGGVPEFAGEYLFQHERERFLIFTCAEHCSQVPGSHPITGDERAELEHRREQVRLALAGKPYRRVQPLSGPVSGA